MTPFQQLWTDRASRFGLSVAIPFTLSLEGEQLTVPVLLRHFGAQNGMLLVTEYALIRPHVDRLAELGYGYACLTEPTKPHEEDDDVLLEVLRDWGWSGDGTPPAWLHDAAG